MYPLRFFSFSLTKLLAYELVLISKHHLRTEKLDANPNNHMHRAITVPCYGFDRGGKKVAARLLQLER